jgi:hypothetical protein
MEGEKIIDHHAIRPGDAGAGRRLPALPHTCPALGALRTWALVQQPALCKACRALMQTATGRALCAKTRQFLVQKRTRIMRVKQPAQRRLVRHTHKHEFSWRHGRKRCKLRRGSPAGGCTEEVLSVLGRLIVVFRWVGFTVRKRYRWRGV